MFKKKTSVFLYIKKPKQNKHIHCTLIFVNLYIYIINLNNKKKNRYMEYIQRDESHAMDEMSNI